MGKSLFSLTKKHFRFDFFRAGGKGGQKQNKTSSGCRVTHIETGICAEARDSRSQLLNKENAFRRLTKKPEFQLWLKKEIARKSMDEVALKRKIDKMINDKENLKVEVFNSETGKWESDTD